MNNYKVETRSPRVKIKKRRKGIKFLIFILLILGIVYLGKAIINERKNIELTNSIYNFLDKKDNRIKAYNSAVVLNNNNSSNTCVYFVSEVIRQNGIPIAKSTANTSQLLDTLGVLRWKKDTDYKKLQPGDIVFTTDEYGNKKGTPSHTYVFMNWVEEGNYEYAYICDNQAKDYGNMIYHKRNIKNIDKANGTSKDAFSFFMKP